MTRQKIDTLWFKAMHESFKDGEKFTRYHFAKLVAAAEREACARLCDEVGSQDCDSHAWDAAAAIRARGEK
jgi:hypothetical protein